MSVEQFHFAWSFKVTSYILQTGTHILWPMTSAITETKRGIFLIQSHRTPRLWLHIPTYCDAYFHGARNLSAGRMVFVVSDPRLALARADIPPLYRLSADPVLAAEHC